MDHAQKIFLVPQHQLEKLRESKTTSTDVRQSVQNDLDSSIRNILLKPDMDLHEKAKRYSAILQRFLTVVRQGELDTNTLTLSLPVSETGSDVLNVTETKETVDRNVDLVDEILDNVPVKRRKNVEYILNRMHRSKDLLHGIQMVNSFSKER